MYSHLESIRATLGAQLEKVQSTLEQRLTEIQADIATKQTLHVQEHQADRDRRNSLMRWAVTSILSGFGVVVAIWVAMRSG